MSRTLDRTGQDELTIDDQPGLHGAVLYAHAPQHIALL